MHIADPAQLKPPLESVAAFRCNPEHLAAKLLATEVDEFSSPGPARLGAIELANGATVGVVIHDHGKFAEILARLSTDIERTLLESFLALEVSASDIDWIREGIDQSAIVSAMDHASSDGTEKHGFRVELAPQFETTAQEMLLTSAEARALTLLVVQVSREPHLATVIGDTGIRMLRAQHTILADGAEVAPLAIFYCVTADRSGVTILDVQRLGASDISISQCGFLDDAIEEAAGRRTNVYGDRKEAAPVLHHRPRTVAATVLDAREILRHAS